jgi:alpha/beta superfamily hydrolase
LIAVGFPTSPADFEYFNRCELPKYFVQSTNDQFGPRDVLEEVFKTFADPRRLEFIEAGDHFFAGALNELEAAIAALPR